MAVSEQIIKELESRVGVEGQPLEYEIEKGMIKRYAAAIGDPNPLWQDEGYAAGTRYGCIVAPPNFILTLGFGRVLQKYLEDPEITVLHGSTDVEYRWPVKAGDVISVSATVSKVRQRQSKLGDTLFVTFDMKYRNQHQQAVAECRQLAIFY